MHLLDEWPRKPQVPANPGIRVCAVPSRSKVDSSTAHSRSPTAHTPACFPRLKATILLKNCCRSSLTLASLLGCKSFRHHRSACGLSECALGRRDAMSASFLASAWTSSSHSLARRALPSVCSAHPAFGVRAARCQHQCAASLTVSMASRSSYLGATLATPPGLASSRYSLSPSRHSLQGLKSCFALSPVADVVLRACCRAGKEALFTGRCAGVHDLWLCKQSANAIEQLQFIMQYTYMRSPSRNRDVPACTDTGIFLWSGGA